MRTPRNRVTRSTSMRSPDPLVAVPTSFRQYLQSLGPGIVVALTWLGGGDLVDSAVAGGSYGYTLMWATVIALFVRFVFVSVIAKYQLCNQHGESVVSGLKRLHPVLPALVGVITLCFGHFYGSYMVKGIGETTTRLLSAGSPWAWSVAIQLGDRQRHRLRLPVYGCRRGVPIEGARARGTARREPLLDLPRGSRLVPGLAPDLEPPGYAGLHHAHYHRQRRSRGPAPGSFCQPPVYRSTNVLHWPDPQERLVGKQPDGYALRLLAVGSLPVRSVGCRSATVRIVMRERGFE